MMFDIKKDGDPVLKVKAKKVDEINEDIKAIVNSMFETMYDYKGVGLAAPQVGISKKIIVVDPGEFPLALINPSIERKEGEVIDVEGCLSVPGIVGEVPRAEKIAVTGMLLNGKVKSFDVIYVLARIIQHEIDHLEGILFTSKALRTRRS